MLFEHGLGVPEDKPKALEWYRKVIDGGDVNAKINIDRVAKYRDKARSGLLFNKSINGPKWNGHAF